MDKREQKLIEVRSKILARKRIMQFGIFAAAVIPIIIGLTYIFKFVAEMKTAPQVFIYLGVIILLFTVYYFFIIIPFEKYQTKLRNQRKEEREKMNGEASQDGEEIGE